MNNKPNFIIIYPDTLGANALGCYGNPTVKTPNIDLLAKSGFKFNECTSQNPVCCPSRASMLTGKYVSAHGIKDNDVAPYPEGHLTIPVFLKKQGYDTAYFGKTHSVNPAEWDKVFDIYSDYNKYLSGRGYNVRYPESLPPGKLGGYSEIPSKDWITNVLGNMGCGFIEDRKKQDNPFALFVSFEAPHSPVTVPRDEEIIYDPNEIVLPQVPEDELENKPPERAAYLKARSKTIPDEHTLKEGLAFYYALVSLVDKNVGKIIDKLEESGLRENTVVIFMSDHGDFMGNHNCVGKTMSIDQSLIHVPLIINAPGITKAAGSDALVQSIDIFPTIAELCDVETPAGLQGESLLQHMKNPAAQGREYAFSEEFYSKGIHYFAARNKTHKFILSSTGFEELYDLKKDPWEWRNIADNPQNKHLLERFKNELLMWRFKCIDMTVTRKHDWIDKLVNENVLALPQNK